jgi:HlyD family secretion protein
MKRIAIITVAVIAVGSLTIVGARLKPAAPTVNMSEQYPGTVKRGPMERQVRGLGRLTPEEYHWLAAAQESRVSQIVRRAGIDPVKANDIILVLSDPDLELEAEKAEWQCKQDEANLANLKVKLESDKLDQRATLAQLESEYTQAKLTADRDLELTRLSLKSDLESRLSVDSANQFQNRVALQKERLAIGDQSITAQIEAQRARSGWHDAGESGRSDKVESGSADTRNADEGRARRAGCLGGYSQRYYSRARDSNRSGRPERDGRRRCGALRATAAGGPAGIERRWHGGD